MRNERVKEYIERAEGIINPEKEFDWYIMCDKATKTSSEEMILKETLEIMESLENCSIEKVAEEFLNKNYEHNIAYKILNIVLNYSSKGPDFIETVMGDKLSTKDIQSIQQIREINQQSKSKM